MISKHCAVYMRMRVRTVSLCNMLCVTGTAAVVAVLVLVSTVDVHLREPSSSLYCYTLTTTGLC
jgi:hypothetical protein